MHTESAFVRSQRVVSLQTVEVNVRSPTPAKCVTVQILLGTEELVFNAPSQPLMTWAGFHCHLGHGVLRFSDAQRCLSLELTDGAIIEQPWAMKNQQLPAPVAALRVVWSGRDWAKQSMLCLQGMACLVKTA